MIMKTETLDVNGRHGIPLLHFINNYNNTSKVRMIRGSPDEILNNCVILAPNLQILAHNLE